MDPKENDYSHLHAVAGTAEYKPSDFNSGVVHRNLCPVCGKYELEPFEVCGCGWENDIFVLDDPDYAGGANEMSINEARKAYAEWRQIK